jgi:hypothetical protein
MSTEGLEFVIPSSDADRKRLKVMLEEAVGTLIRADAEKSHKKEIMAAIKDEFQIDLSILNRVVAMRHKQTFTQVETKQEATRDLYTTLFGED